jgi:hypothetical protein
MADVFPDEVIHLLRRTVFQPDAQRHYDMLSDSFWWSDELLLEMAGLCLSKKNWAFRTLLSYRGTLIQGQPCEQLRAPWDQLARECPNWPGFRPERRSTELLPALQRAGRRALISCEQADREYRRKQKNAEQGAAADRPRE